MIRRAAVAKSLVVTLVAGGVCFALLGAYLLFLKTEELSQLTGGESSEAVTGDLDLTSAEQAAESRPLALDGQPAKSRSASLPPLSATEPASPQDAIAEAEGVLEHLVVRFPKYPDALEMLARFRYWTGETAAAQEAWRRSLELDPTYAHAYEGLASVAAKRGEYQAAIAHYRKALDINARSPTLRVELAKALIAHQQIDEAITLLEETVELFPNQTDAFYQLGIAYQQREDFGKAKQSFETTLAQLPQYSAAQVGLAQSYLRLGLEEEARRHIATAEQLRAKEAEQSRQARLQYDDAAATRQEVARLYVDAGRVYLTQGEPEAAKRLWTRAGVLDRRNLDCRQALAWLNLQQGDIEATVERLHELAALEPNNIGYPLEIARLYGEMGRVAEAEQMLQSVRKAAPKDAAGHAALAQLYLQTGQNLPQALQLATQAVELTPSSQHYALLSGAYERSQRWDDAAEAMAEAIRLEPQNARYRQAHAVLQQQAMQSSKQGD